LVASGRAPGSTKYTRSIPPRPLVVATRRKKRTTPVLTVHDLEIQVGARLLMRDVDFQVAPGDKVGLVGRNGAGKTTLTKVLAGETLPTAGRVERSGELGYLPQDPRSGDPDQLARTRILDA